MNKNSITAEKKKNIVYKYIFCYGLLLIPIVHFIIFWLIVNVNSLILPFQDDVTGRFTWGNFKEVFTLMKGNGDLVLAFKNTLKYYVVGLITAFVMAPLFSYFLYKKIAGYRLFSILFMLPMMVSSIIMISIYKNFVGTHGPIGELYDAIKGGQNFLLYDPKTATSTIIGYVIWTGFGTNLILFSGAMAKIPPEIIESAELDGIGFFREFFSIVLPLIWPTLSITLLLGVNGIFSASGPILYFTNGMYDTMTISHWFYAKVIVGREYELASAFGLLLTIGGLPLVGFVQWLRRKISTDVTY